MRLLPVAPIGWGIDDGMDDIDQSQLDDVPAMEMIVLSQVQTHVAETPESPYIPEKGDLP